MTKGRFIVSALTVMAAAGAVVTGVLMKNRGKIKVEGELETKSNGAGGAGRKKKTVRGAAAVGSTGANRPM